jgi:hypothetical protein
MLAICQPYLETAVESGNGQDAIYLPDRLAVTGRGAVRLWVAKRGKVPVEIFGASAGPGVGNGKGLSQEPELSFEVGIQHPAGNAVGVERCRKHGNARRRLARLGNGWGDE